MQERRPGGLDGGSDCVAFAEESCGKERAVLELLRRKRQLLVSSRTRLTDALDGLLTEAALAQPPPQGEVRGTKPSTA